MLKELRIALLALASLVPMFAILWWTNSLDYEDELYERFRERSEAIIDLQDIERLSQLADYLPSLIRLTIHLNGDAPLPPSLAKLQQVTYLKLVGDGGANDISVIQKLPKVKVLQLEYFSSIQLQEVVAPLRQLKKLYVEHCRWTSLPETLEQFKALEVLSLRYNQLTLNALDGVDWYKLEALEYLDLGYNSLNRVPISLLQHPQLIYLDLASNEVAYLEPVEVPKAVPLQLLRLNRNRLTDLSNILDSCTALRTLDLASNQLYRLPSRFSWPALEDLRLSGNQLERLPTAVGNLQELKVLDVSNNQLTELPAEVGTLPDLLYLDLADNAIEQLEVGDIGWEQLRNLYLERNKLTRLPSRLLELPDLNRISIEGNVVLLEDEWFERIKPRGWEIQDRDLDILPSWGTWSY